MHYTEIYNSHTVSDDIVAPLKAMPKIELHIHLEGAMEPRTAYEMAQRNHIPLPVSSLVEWERAYAFRDFNQFITLYRLAATVLRTREDYTLMMEGYMRLQAEQNIAYSEVFLSTALHLHKLPADDLLSALELGIRRGNVAFGTQVKLIPDISRQSASGNLPLQQQVLDFAIRAYEGGIGIGLGLGGNEVGNPAEQYAPLFAAARERGLRVVAHAGETVGATSIWSALQALGAERIGHGVRAVEDPTLMAHLRESQIPLEVSPHANYCLGVVPHDQPHPIGQLVAAGVLCTVNTDCPPFYNTNLTNEYLTLAAQGFTFEELWQLNLNAVEASFLSEAEKATYRQRVGAKKGGQEMSGETR
jgi:adenosine deaminase